MFQKLSPLQRPRTIHIFVKKKLFHPDLTKQNHKNAHVFHHLVSHHEIKNSFPPLPASERVLTLPII